MSDSLSLTFQALADPTRRALLARLAKGEASVGDLAKPFLSDMSLPAITKHLKVLETAGLVSQGKDAQFRPRKLNGDGLKVAADWMEQYRFFWEESFDRLEAYLKTVTAKPKPAPRTTPKSSPKTSPKRKSKGKTHGRKK